ncbi:type II secretion system protein N [Aquabacterium sp.]|uniref:type II secretion system protein N n=1 Tax=Aquabacterium sp. TaxID=1872578 RepID=UPI002C9D9EF7|nr:type II secretion system protein N [Aquabacterium sp.]HSW07113.1 type II secretion system protein N [Aquabacterium sp.]
MTSRLLSFVIWLAVAATAVFWGLRLTAGSRGLPPHATLATQALPQGGDLTRLFGSPPPEEVAAVVPVAADSRFKLLGVVAPARGQHAGLALIAVDGKTPRAVAVGGRVDGDLVVRSISHRRVELGNDGSGPPSVMLELPAVAEAARGSLPVAQGEAGVPPPPSLPVAPIAALPAPMLQRRPGTPPMRPALPMPAPVAPAGATSQPPAFGITPQTQVQPPNDGLPATR